MGLGYKCNWGHRSRQRAKGAVTLHPSLRWGGQHGQAGTPCSAWQGWGLPLSEQQPPCTGSMSNSLPAWVARSGPHLTAERAAAEDAGSAGGCRQAAPRAAGGREDRALEKGHGHQDCLGMDEWMHGRLQGSKMTGRREAGDAGDAARVPGHCWRTGVVPDTGVELDTPAGSGKRQRCCRAFDTQETAPINSPKHWKCCQKKYVVQHQTITALSQLLTCDFETKNLATA